MELVDGIPGSISGRSGREGQVLDAVGRVLLLMLEIGSEDSIC